MKQPSIFISHGAPSIVIDQSPASFAVMELARQLERPDAIIVASAHFETNVIEVVSDPHPETMHDFGGFDPRLYEMKYTAPGNPQLAQIIIDRFADAGLKAKGNARRPYDHGVWTPLMLAFPEADIPVVQVSVQPNDDAAHHYAVGQALAGLRNNNVLVVGSGHITHNLFSVFNAMRYQKVDMQMKAKVEDFVNWVDHRLVSNDKAALLEWETNAPYAHENHPSNEHFLPLFVAYGAGGDAPKSTLLHRSTQYEIFTSDIWRFD